MCGLTGIAGSIDKTDTKVFEELLYIAALRGTDSTGLAALAFKGKAKVYEEPLVIKCPQIAADFLDRNTVKQAISVGRCLLMGHTRWGTVGKINKQNAQPFDYDHIVGTHNGTLSWGAKYKLEGKDRNFGTDSAALYASIDEKGLNKTLALLDDEDAMALVWFDTKTGTLNLYRNEQRPLHYVFDKSNSTFYWASEPWMLYMALNRNNVSFKKVKTLEPFIHLCIEMPDEPGFQFAKPVMTRIKMQKHPVPVQQTYGVEGYLFKDKGEKKEGQIIPFVNPPISSAVSSITKPGMYSRAEDLKEKMQERWRLSTIQQRSDAEGGRFYKTSYGKNIGEVEFMEIADSGCAICGVVPEFGEPVKFVQSGGFICAQCMAAARSGKDSTLLETVLTVI